MYLGIDYGKRNIGVAISEIGIAIPHAIYDHEEFFIELPELIEKRKIKVIVIGEAIGYDAYGKQKKTFQKAIERIKKTVPDIQVEIQDEDLTTFEAQESLGKLDSDEHLDDIAASIILQRYLDKQ
ncbi:Holliday junction resolvase RuvX [Candidatus Gracilibacteria bacterium]|nr:Holliday junction resolvase RuvX [Candidatus Gracilibacteria bacterium]